MPSTPSPLYPWQREAILKAVPVLQYRGGFYLDHAVGSGKTLTAICISRMLNVRRLVIVCPLVALGVWRDQIQKWWPDPPLLSPDGLYRAINYDRLDSKMVSALIKLKPDLLILDEAHMCKSVSSNRRRAVDRIAKASKYRLLLSGTPAHNPLDWWAQYRIIAPRDPMWAQKYSDYRSFIAILKGPLQNWVDKDRGERGFRPEAKQAALRAMEPYTHIYDGSTMNLPEPVETKIPVILEPEARRVYREMERDALAKIQRLSYTPRGLTAPDEYIDAPIVLTQMLRLHQITSGFAPDQEGVIHQVSGAKLLACAQLLEARQNRKCVVVCRFHEEALQLAGILRKNHQQFLVIDGSVKAEERERRVAQFQHDSTSYVMILQPKAGGVAIDLTATQTAIFYSLDQSCITFQQVIGRWFRNGQRRHVEVLPLLAEDTIDEAMWDSLKEGLDAVDLAKLLVKELTK